MVFSFVFYFCALYYYFLTDFLKFIPQHFYIYLFFISTIVLSISMSSFLFPECPFLYHTVFMLWIHFLLSLIVNIKSSVLMLSVLLLSFFLLIALVIHFTDFSQFYVTLNSLFKFNLRNVPWKSWLHAHCVWDLVVVGASPRLIAT